jgi:hypothetical protein
MEIITTTLSMRERSVRQIRTCRPRKRPLDVQ